MVNQKGEFPKTEKVSARIHASTKRKLNKLPYSTAEVIEYGAEQLFVEENKLEWEIGELKIEISKIKSKLHEKEALLQAKQNRLRDIAPSKLDEKTLNNLLISSAKEYAQEIFDAHGEDSLVKLENITAKKAVISTANEWGYDDHKFLVEVKNQLEILCRTFR